ncbi:MAG: hypothetical protein KGL12_14770 [Rhodospirillales bacterium]|nr:hypothetical protein [Rhodospirillales bacterium]
MDVPPSPRRWVGPVASLLPALAFLPAICAPPFNHDVAAVLQFSQRWLDGARLYRDLLDVNPPLIFVLNLLPAMLARTGLIGALWAVRLCVFALGVLAWRLSWRVRDRAGEGAAGRAFHDILPGLLLLCAGYDFAQREHLMLIAALPYLFAAARRAAGQAVPRGALAGAVILAALGFALKPYFLGIPALVEAWVLCRRPDGARAGLIDPVPWAMAAIWAAYLAAIAIFLPAYGALLHLVFRLYVPRGLSLEQTLTGSRMGAVECFLAALSIVLVWRIRRIRRASLLAVFWLAAIGALASAIVQHKGWSYHVVPIEMFTCALACEAATGFLDRLGHPGVAAARHRIAACCAGLFALYAISNGEAPWKEIAYPGSEVAQLVRILQAAPRGRVLVLAPGIYPIYPALNMAHDRQALDAMNLWVLQGLYRSCLADGARYRPRAAIGPTERHVLDDAARALAARPVALVVDTVPGIPWCGSEFDILTYFRRDPLFAASFARYHLAARFSHFLVFRPKETAR